MRNNRKNLLERLYGGEFAPAEQAAPGNPNYASIGHQAEKEIEYIESQLDSKDNARFQTLLDLMGDMESISGYSNFAYGLRTGIQLMIELFFNEDRPPFKVQDYR